jgi:hypothetical protein
VKEGIKALSNHFAQKILKNSEGSIYLIQGIDKASSRKAYYYVLVKPAMEENIQRMALLDTMDISRFGTVIESGFGYAPPKKVEDGIIATYGT